MSKTGTGDSGKPIQTGDRARAGSPVADLGIPEREALYRSMFERNQAVKLLIDPESGGIVDANAAAVEFYGYARDVFLGMSIFEINTLPRDAVLEALGTTREGSRTTFSFRHRLASGEEREVEVFSGPVEIQGRTYLHSIVQDVTERSRATRAVAASEARYRQIVDTAQEGIWTIDAAANTSFVNRRMAEMLGYAPEEMLGRPLLGFMTEEAQEDAKRNLERRRHGVIEVHEFRFRKKDGAEIWARVATNPLLGADGVYSGALAMVTDITERRRTEEVLRRHQEVFELSQRSAGAGFWTWDIASGHLEWTAEMFHLFGLDPVRDAATFDTWKRVLHPEDRDAAAGRIAAAIESRSFLDSDYRIVHPGGRVRWIRALGNSTCDADGRPLRMAGLCLDITDRKETEASLRVKAAVIDSAINGIAISGLDGRLTYVNDAFVRMWGYATAGEILGTLRFEYWENPGAVVPVVEAVTADGQWVGELVARRKDGSNFQCQVVTNRVDDDSGRPICFLASFLDVSERKATEGALRASEQRLRSVLENLQDAYFRADLSGQYLLVSPSASRLFGYDSVEEMMAVPARDLYLRPEDRLEVMSRVHSGEHIGDWIGVARRKDGSPFWISMAAYPVRDELGRIVGSQSVVRDISERVRVGERLKESERKLRIVADNTHDWEFWEDPEGRFLYCSPSCERVTGRGAEEFLADPELLAKIVHPEDLAPFLDHKRIRLGAGASGRRHDRTEHTFRIVRPDGTVRWIGHVCATLVDDEGRFLGLRGSNRDISERKKVEESLAKERDLLHQAERLAHVGSWEWDIQRDRWVQSEEWLQIHGLTAGHPLSTEEMLRIADPEDVERVGKAFHDVLEGGAAYDIEHRIVRQSDGEVRFVHARGEAIRDAEGRPLRLVGMAQDITELKRAEGRIRSLNEELEQRVAARTADLEAAVKDREAFSYSVAHDLRAPVRAIDGFAAKLDRGYGGALDDEGRRLLGTVRSSSNRMGRLIDDLLSFSRTARAEVRKGTVDMETLIREVIAESRQTSVGPAAAFRIGQVPKAEGDAALLREVLHNLVSNALKFSAVRPEPVVEIGSRSGSDGPEYFVRDNGVGFDPRFGDKLFGVFQRLHGATELEGTGIGLALVKRIVEKHGGRVWAEGTPDGGATFWFSLPAGR